MDKLATDGPQGAIAQLVERVLCKHEVVGSIPSGSTMRTPSSRSGNNRIPAWPARRPGGFDIVNEGSVRRSAKRGFKGGPEKTSLSGKIYQSACMGALPVFQAGDGTMHEFC